ncbi:hypothetical protein FIBSPDRAFT_570069 [Athelia psychrophila]|uniref:Uncharacterized protein n=1 Tax=Athelia psychrophila TaxID=1759441 RepID=A0A166HQB2_9AGAM|nr:hypothetical protein FIBSPDRAFT_570069 [Fibularhizoctonia sp. CBS 109695]
MASLSPSCADSHFLGFSDRHLPIPALHNISIMLTFTPALTIGHSDHHQATRGRARKNIQRRRTTRLRRTHTGILIRGSPEISDLVSMLGASLILVRKECQCSSHQMHTQPSYPRRTGQDSSLIKPGHGITAEDLSRTTCDRNILQSVEEAELRLAVRYESRVSKLSGAGRQEKQGHQKHMQKNQYRDRAKCYFGDRKPFVPARYVFDVVFLFAGF